MRASIATSVLSRRPFFCSVIHISIRISLLNLDTCQFSRRGYLLFTSNYVHREIARDPDSHLISDFVLEFNVQPALLKVGLDRLVNLVLSPKQRFRVFAFPKSVAGLHVCLLCSAGELHLASLHSRRSPAPKHASARPQNSLFSSTSVLLFRSYPPSSLFLHLISLQLTKIT